MYGKLSTCVLTNVLSHVKLNYKKENWVEKMQTIKTEFLIIGSGIAGLSTALGSSPYGKVIVISKGRQDLCNSTLAQGGIAAALGGNDSPKEHTRDTLIAGVGICERKTVEILTEEAPTVIGRLIELGTSFNRTDLGELALGREGAHSLARVIHRGDDTGMAVWETLFRKAQEQKVHFLAETRAEILLVEAGHCYGAIVRNSEGVHLILARSVVLATGGIGEIYGRTTNSLQSTGEGLALAWKAGAVLSDLEFIQFHPTALASEGNHFEQRFPNIYAKIQSLGLDPREDLLPITPAAHFSMGGIRTDSFGRTNIQGLYACGECANTGVHGANRLASNSLLEGLVFGKRVAQMLAESLKEIPSCTLGSTNKGTSKDVTALDIAQLTISLNLNDPRVDTLQKLMWSSVGIIRDKHGMTKAYQELYQLEKEVSPTEAELQNMILVAKLITSSALKRLESRGSHYRLDYPEVDPAWQTKHLSLRRYSA